MKYYKSCGFEGDEILPLATRRSVLGFFGLFLLMPLMACGQGGKKMQKGIVLNVEMISYVDHVITNIIFNGEDLGVMNKFGATGTIAGVHIPFGIQTLHWELDGPKGTPRIGEVVTLKNQLVILPEQIPAGTRYLGLHLYPDDTAEIIFSESVPDVSARGKKIRAARR
ncbi:hypothetical protein O3297_05135 [Janthinobacterium sp. SUN128]|uniref:hypothetical protein n=1 Tax=Janthinobacterium sp. SUN128 TaxID=3014790 RepID=UPI0027138C42|nr:hypothetical protein [Janthinobacterium sp. SUN128]MDO8032785.1 hypothetical protein [Janthinobacterium sp. SUN128]